MGMYTELLIKARVREDAPGIVGDVLNHLFNKKDAPLALPYHPFFDCERWKQIGSMSSFYHVPWASSCYRDGYLFSRCDLKEYDDEIAKFVDWLMPYVGEYWENGHVMGWRWYEEDNEPTLIRYKR